MLVGFAIWLPVVLASGVPPGFTPIDYFWLAASGVGNVLGLMATYAAYRIGKVGVVAAVASTEGAIVALIAVAAGEHVAPLSAALLAVIVASVVVVAATRDPAPIERAHPSRAALLAGLSAALFGISLYATSQLGRSVSLAWAVLPPRALGVAVLAIPLVIRGRLQSVRKAMPLVISTGVSEVLGRVRVRVRESFEHCDRVRPGGAVPRHECGGRVHPVPRAAQSNPPGRSHRSGGCDRDTGGGLGVLAEVCVRSAGQGRSPTSSRGDSDAISRVPDRRRYRIEFGQGRGRLGYRAWM